MATTSRAPTGQQSQTLQSAPQTTSTTTTATQTQTQAPTQAILHLRGAPLNSERGSSRRRIQWAEDVVDNEGLGRKKSKVCCIYHAPREFGESSDESSSESESSSDESGDDGRARMGGGGKKGKGHGEGDGCGHGHKHGKGEGHAGGKGERKRSPNAYERIPKVKGAAKEK